MNLIKRCRYGLMIYNMNDVPQGRTLDFYGEYAEEIAKLLKSLVQPDFHVLDIGANIGSLSLVFSRLVPKGSVIAFEPERKSFYSLCGSVAVNNISNVYCFQQALSNRTGIINVPELDVHQTTDWGGVDLRVDYSNAAHYPVGLNTIDTLSLEKCHFIKSTTGMEREILEGGKETIKRFKPILYLTDRPEIRPIVKDFGYQLYQHQAKIFNPDNFFEKSDNIVGNGYYSNLLCLPEKTTCPSVREFRLQMLS